MSRAVLSSDENARTVSLDKTFVGILEECIEDLNRDAKDRIWELEYIRTAVDKFGIDVCGIPEYIETKAEASGVLQAIKVIKEHFGRWLD